MERWKWIPGFRDYYQASTKGRLRSVPRTIIRVVGTKSIHQTLKGKVLRPGGASESMPYLTATLYRKGKKYDVLVHKVIATTFIPNPNNLPEVNHKDLNKTNNRADNLEWCTSAQNKTHAVDNGVDFNPNPLKGEDAAAAKLTWEKVRKIRSLYRKKRNLIQKRLAIRFGVTQANISSIVLNKTWVEDQNQAGLTMPKVDGPPPEPVRDPNQPPPWEDGKGDRWQAPDGSIHVYNRNTRKWIQVTEPTK